MRRGRVLRSSTLRASWFGEPPIVLIILDTRVTASIMAEMAAGRFAVPIGDASTDLSPTKESFLRGEGRTMPSASVRSQFLPLAPDWTPSVPSYRAIAPLIHPSRLTTRDRGGVGKDLSEGWCLNFAV